MDIIEIEHLKKYYGTVKAVDDISFSVREGEFFAFLGINGAGKSTTISVLCGKEPCTEGKVRIRGMEVGERLGEAKEALGVVFQDSVLDKSLSVYDNLRLRAALYGITGKAFRRRFEELNALFGLSFARRAVGKLSGGQRRRVDIARALIHDPRILILDEPTTGLDPRTRQTIWAIVHGLRKTRRMTVFLTTHYMEEAADADRVAFIDDGKILACDTPINLKEKYTGDFITLYHVREEELKNAGLAYRRTGEDAFRIEVESTRRATELILAHPALFRDYEIAKGKMDDVFLAVTGKTLGFEGKEEL